ncbi:MAG: hypothetical protein V3V29_05635 [Acidimicrobiia bacterium]
MPCRDGVARCGGVWSGSWLPKGFKILLSEEDIDSLVAFLLTQ